MAQAGLSDDDIFAGKVTDKWRNFMKSQIKRARMFFDEAEKGVTELNEASRWPVRLQSFYHCGISYICVLIVISTRISFTSKK